MTVQPSEIQNKNTNLDSHDYKFHNFQNSHQGEHIPIFNNDGARNFRTFKNVFSVLQKYCFTNVTTFS